MSTQIAPGSTANSDNALRPGEMRAHLEFSIGKFFEPQRDEAKEPGPCSSHYDSDNG